MLDFMSVINNIEIPNIEFNILVTYYVCMSASILYATYYATNRLLNKKNKQKDIVYNLRNRIVYTLD